MEKTKVFHAPTELEASFVSMRGVRVIHVLFVDKWQIAS